MLENINTPNDLKKLNIDELALLAEEIRKTIIETVLKTGGHLSSNLGVIELTLALHYVFNCPKDKIIWDVGHQTYAHKLITGQKNIFHTLRQYNGLSGFPDPSKNIYDCFGTGHSSTSISAILGMAVAKDILKENYYSIAVIGDGSLTGGIAFEGLNNAGHLQKNMIIILNDNKMSISKNVGALSTYLNKLIIKRSYNTFKDNIKKLLKLLPFKIRKNIIKLIKKIEEGIKNLIVPGIFFEELGIRYFGPIDGHDTKTLIEIFEKTKDLKGPILIHIITKKGKGYSSAEKNPTFYHSGTSFDKNNKTKTYSQIFGESLLELALSDSKIIGITAAMTEGTGLNIFAERLPNQFFDVGIAEQHAITFAAGLAMQKLKPVIFIYSTFLQRAYDQILHDVCRQNLPVIFAIDKAGITGPDGETHQGVFDIAYLRHIPNLVIMAPSNANEIKKMLEFALKLQKPIAIRYPSAKILEKNNQEILIELGKAKILQEGEEIVLFAIGVIIENCIEAADILFQEKKKKITVVDLRFIKPLDEKLICNLCKKHKKIITVEDGIIAGGVGTGIMELLAKEHIIASKIKIIGFPDEFISHGQRNILLEKYGLDKFGIYQEIIKML
ncbi:MAG: 1-deoxy-D-xylulose-5-phosphate synthase [bacterium]